MDERKPLNVGKSTLYNALANCSIPAENFPFCTIEVGSQRHSAPVLASVSTYPPHGF